MVVASAFFSILLVGITLSFSGYTIGDFALKFLRNSPSSDMGVLSRESAPSLGRPDAPVQIVVFADFQCPLCAIFHFGAQEAIIEEYVKKGAAQLTFRHYPMLGNESLAAAQASECAREQGKFWEYENTLFERRSQNNGEDVGVFSRANLVHSAEGVGLEKNMFEQCLSSGRPGDALARDMEAANAAGVRGAPTIFINGEKMEGLLSFEVYAAAIEKK